MLGASSIAERTFGRNTVFAEFSLPAAAVFLIMIVKSEFGASKYGQRHVGLKGGTARSRKLGASRRADQCRGNGNGYPHWEKTSR